MSRNNKIVEVIDINVEEILFARSQDNKRFDKLNECKEQLLGKRIYITVIDERSKRVVFTLEITEVDDKSKGDKRLTFKVLETGATFSSQTHAITHLINEPNKPININLLNNKLFYDMTNTSSNRGKAKNNITSEEWQELFNSKLDTQGYTGGVYLISGTIDGTKYYYIGVTDDYKQRFKQHYIDGQGGRYEVTSDMILQADDGTMKAIVVTDGVFNKDYMEKVMETVFTSLFEFTGVKVVNSPKSGKYKSREELIELLLVDNKPCEVEILWNEYELVKSYEPYITDNDLYYINELYKIAYKQDMTNSLIQLLDELEVPLNEFITYILQVKIERRGFGKISIDKIKPTEMPKGRSKSRFDGYLGYKYNENPKYNKSKPYYKYDNGRWVNLSVKDMEQLVQLHVDRNSHAILDVQVTVNRTTGQTCQLEVLTVSKKEPIIICK